MRRPSARRHLKNFCDWEQKVTNKRLYNHAGFCKSNAYRLFDWCLSLLQSSSDTHGETIGAIFLAIMFPSLLFCSKSPSHSPSLRTQPRWLIQVLLQIMIDVGSISDWHFLRSDELNSLQSTLNVRSVCQLMSYIERKHCSWLWPAAVLINSRGFLIEAFTIVGEKSLLSFLIDSQWCFHCQVTGTEYEVN